MSGKWEPGDPTRPNAFAKKKKRRAQFRELGIKVPVRQMYNAKLEIIQFLEKCLPTTWENFKANAHKYHRYTKKKVLFAQYYAANGRSNKADALRRAGYDYKNYDGMYTMIKKILESDGMEELLRAFEQENRMSARINVDQVVEYFKNIADQAMVQADFTNANRAMENLGKFLQMFVTKTEITHKTVASKEELDERIATYQRILAENADEVNKNLGITTH